MLLTLANPNGIQVLLYPFRLAAFLLDKGDQLETGHFTGATPAAASGFFLLVAILLFAMLPRDRLQRLTLRDVLMVSAFLLLALLSHRFIFYFTLFALPVIAVLVAQPSGGRYRLLDSASLRRAAIGLIALIMAVATARAWSDRETRTVSRHFPSGAVSVMQRNDLAGRGFNHQNYGGYLYWNLAEPIFWDGRNLLFASLMDEISTMTLEEVTTRWQIDHLLLTEFEYTRMGEQIDPRQWGLLHWDDHSALFLRRSEDHVALLERAEVRQFPPFGGVEGLNLQAANDAWTVRARKELDQILRAEPLCQRALYLKGLINFYRGEFVRAEEDLLKALQIAPNEHVSRALTRVRESSYARPESSNGSE